MHYLIMVKNKLQLYFYMHTILFLLQQKDIYCIQSNGRIKTFLALKQLTTGLTIYNFIFRNLL